MSEQSRTPEVERRQYVRVDYLMASRVVSIDIKNPEKENVTHAFTKNVSAGGLLFKDTRNYDLGQLVVISVNSGVIKDLDRNLAEVIKTQEHVLGRVVRKEEFDDGKFYEYGICFVRHDEKGLDYFNVFVNLINQIRFKD